MTSSSSMPGTPSTPSGVAAAAAQSSSSSSSSQHVVCRCGSVVPTKVASPAAQFPGRPYWKCSSCGHFEWFSIPTTGRHHHVSSSTTTSTSAHSQVTGPSCRCGKATIELTVTKVGPNKGRKFHRCATWQGKGGCNFWEWSHCNSKPTAAAAAAPPSSSLPAPSSPTLPSSAAAPRTSIIIKNPYAKVTPSPRSAAGSLEQRPAPAAAVPGFATFLSDWKTVELLSKMLQIYDVATMNRARFERGDMSTYMYDDLDVKYVWKISNAARLERYQAAVRRETLQCKLTSTTPHVASTSVLDDMRSSYRGAMQELGRGTLDAAAQEVFLLHGTSHDNLYDILFDGLDPDCSLDGCFGAGTYFADDSAKMDQYATLDKCYDASNRLHQKLYQGTARRHPRNVRYALVCRVVLGSFIETSDGQTELIGRDDDDNDDCQPLRTIFTDRNRRALSKRPDGTVPSSLVGVPGGRVKHYREYVIFNGDQVFVSYLVAYQRVRRKCECGLDVTERTVTKDGSINRGRTIHLCGAIATAGATNCNFIEMFPLCHCGTAAEVKTSRSAANPGRLYYACRRGCSKFIDWADDLLQQGQAYQGTLDEGPSSSGARKRLWF